MQNIDDVRTILSETLGLAGRAKTLTAESALIGSIPEFDSMAVVNLITALEDYFGISIEDDEISGKTFESLGTLTQFVNEKLSR